MFDFKFNENKDISYAISSKEAIIILSANVFFYFKFFDTTYTFKINLSIEFVKGGGRYFYFCFKTNKNIFILLIINILIGT